MRMSLFNFLGLAQVPLFLSMSAYVFVDVPPLSWLGPNRDYGVWVFYPFSLFSTSLFSHFFCVCGGGWKWHVRWFIFLVPTTGSFSVISPGDKESLVFFSVGFFPG